MTSILLNYGLAFAEGFALILSPCILPILPIMLSGTIEGGKKRPLGIICGFVVTFALFTLFSRVLVQHLGINLDLLRKISFGIIALFGIVLVSDYLSAKFSHFTQWVANAGAGITTNKTAQGGFFSGLLLGAFISLIWVPCGGPIIAAAIVQTAIQKTSWQSFLTFFCFALGSAVPMLFIALVGRKIIGSVNFLKSRSELLRKCFGVIIIIAALVAPFANTIVSGYAPMPEAPNVTKAVTLADTGKLINGLSNPYPAPALQDNSAWINSAPLTLAQLKGKVVLIDFWTYSCINCLRTLPYLTSWYSKYHADGFVIIGVHTPEFEFEKNLTNVQQAVSKDHILYPVALDNNYATWTNYKNRYWPADYLIDKNGLVVYQHFGEGGYAEAEHNIRVLLGIKSPAVAQINKKPEPNITAMLLQTPETYLGYARADSYGGAQPLVYDQVQTYAFPAFLVKDNWALQGKWTVHSERIISAGDNAAIKIHFYARKVFAVMGSSGNKPIVVKILLDGEPIADNAGADVQDSQFILANHTIYEIVAFKQAMTGTLELIPESQGAEFYTFTFGS